MNPRGQAVAAFSVGVMIMNCGYDVNVAWQMAQPEVLRGRAGSILLPVRFCKGLWSDRRWG